MRLRHLLRRPGRDADAGQGSRGGANLRQPGVDQATEHRGWRAALTEKRPRSLDAAVAVLHERFDGLERLYAVELKNLARNMEAGFMSIGTRLDRMNGSVADTIRDLHDHGLDLAEHMTAPGHGRQQEEIETLQADITALLSEHHDSEIRKSVWLAQGKVLLAIGTVLGGGAATGIMFILGMM